MLVVVITLIHGVFYADYDNNIMNFRRDTSKVKGISSSSKQLLPKCEASDHAPSITSSTTSSLRWSKRTFPISSVQSHFNCFLDETLCTYYYPADFFDPECGIGKDYVHFIEDAEAMRRNKTLWDFMPAIGFPTLSMKNTCISQNFTDENGKKDILFGSEDGHDVENHDPFSSGSTLPESTLKDIGHNIFSKNEEQLSCMTERITMLHVHKAGGSSLHEAFDRIERTANSQGRYDAVAQERHKFFTPRAGPDSPRQKQPNQNANNDYDYDYTYTPGTDVPLYKQSLESLKHATKYPQEKYQPEQHVIIALVRDPTERFISSIGQALGAEGSQGNHIGKVLMEECVAGKERSADALKCIAKYVQKHGFWIELHFTPQVIDISFTTMFADVPIGIFSFRNIKTVLNYFGAGNAHSRDGSEKDYRADSILTQMSVDDYDDESLRIVCELYAMDVLMQRSLGMEVERCDPYVPK